MASGRLPQLQVQCTCGFFQSRTVIRVKEGLVKDLLRRVFVSILEVLGRADDI